MCIGEIVVCWFEIDSPLGRSGQIESELKKLLTLSDGLLTGDNWNTVAPDVELAEATKVHKSLVTAYCCYAKSVLNKTKTKQSKKGKSMHFRSLGIKCAERRCWKPPDEYQSIPLMECWSSALVALVFLLECSMDQRKNGRLSLKLACQLIDLQHENYCDSFHGQRNN